MIAALLIAATTPAAATILTLLRLLPTTPAMTPLARMVAHAMDSDQASWRARQLAPARAHAAIILARTERN